MPDRVPALMSRLWYRNHLVSVGVSHDGVTAANTVKLPTCAFEGADKLLRLERRKSVTHEVATMTRSCSEGLGDQPRSRMASR